MSQVRRVTPDALLPETETPLTHPWNVHFSAERYGDAWPLSETYYLCAHAYPPDEIGPKTASNDQKGYLPLRYYGLTHSGEAMIYGICLLDAFGNKELVWREPGIACRTPIPLRPRPAPPVIPDQVQLANPAEQPATVACINVYRSLLPWPKDTRIAALRIVQLYPKSTPLINKPPISFASESLARGVLGTVPVEADGSVHFQVPPNRPVYFQALDEKGMAVQSMRSAAYFKPGERLVCAGCHESVPRAPDAPSTVPLALRRPPSAIRPDADGSWPLSYPRLVQGVLDRHCVECHCKNPRSPDLSGECQGAWTRSYHALVKFAATAYGPTQTRSVPGKIGARSSKLLAMLEKGHHKVKLPADDILRLTLWLGCNSNFYGAYHNTEAQLRGEIVKPDLE
jgi:hypothetical protein